MGRRVGGARPTSKRRSAVRPQGDQYPSHGAPADGLAAARRARKISRTLQKAFPMGPADFRTAYDALPVIVWTSPGDRRWDYVNPRWLEFTRRKLDDELGLGWLDRIHPEDRETF